MSLEERQLRKFSSVALKEEKVDERNLKSSVLVKEAILYSFMDDHDRNT